MSTIHELPTQLRELERLRNEFIASSDVRFRKSGLARVKIMYDAVSRDTQGILGEARTFSDLDTWSQEQVLGLAGIGLMYLNMLTNDIKVSRISNDSQNLYERAQAVISTLQSLSQFELPGHSIHQEPLQWAPEIAQHIANYFIVMNSPDEAENILVKSIELEAQAVGNLLDHHDDESTEKWKEQLDQLAAGYIGVSNLESQPYLMDRWGKISALAVLKMRYAQLLGRTELFFDALQTYEALVLEIRRITLTVEERRKFMNRDRLVALTKMALKGVMVPAKDGSLKERAELLAKILTLRLYIPELLWF